MEAAEGKSYLHLVAASEKFVKSIGEKDLLAENIDRTARKVRKAIDTIENYYDEITTVEVLEELDPLLRKIKAYRMVLAGVQDLRKSDIELWRAVMYILRPAKPSDEMMDKAVKYLERASQFSDLANPTINTQLEKLRVEKLLTKSSASLDLSKLMALVDTPDMEDYEDED